MGTVWPSEEFFPWSFQDCVLQELQALSSVGFRGQHYIQHLLVNFLPSKH